MEASPFKVAVNGCPARMPHSRRVVVPELPVYSVSSGAHRPCRPTPSTMTSLSVISISTPILRKQSMVERQSSPIRKPVMWVVPFASAPSMTER